MEVIWIALALLLAPLYVMILSACAYVGKVWAIRTMFGGGHDGKEA